MDFDLAAAVAVLERTPPTFRSLLAGLGSEWTDATEGPDTWSPYVILGHLIHGERADWIPRARIILDQGADPPHVAAPLSQERLAARRWTAGVSVRCRAALARRRSNWRIALRCGYCTRHLPSSMSASHDAVLSTPRSLALLLDAAGGLALEHVETIAVARLAGTER